MHKKFLTLGATFASIAIIAGAFGAHALKPLLSAENLLSYETAVRYQFYHSIALIIVYLLGEKIISSSLTYAGRFFIAGIILFSGSIYLLSCRELLSVESWKNFLGPITPLGGLCFIAGWICIVIASLKKN